MELQSFFEQSDKVKLLTTKATEKIAFIKDFLNHPFPHLGKRKLTECFDIDGDTTPTQLRLSFNGLKLLFRVEVPFTEDQLSALLAGYTLSQDVPAKENPLGIAYRIDDFGNI